MYLQHELLCLLPDTNNAVVINIQDAPLTTQTTSKMQLKCTKVLISSQISAVTLQLQANSGLSQNQALITKHIDCDGNPSDLMFYNLVGNTQYTIFSVWTTEGSPHLCKVTQFSTCKSSATHFY